jgi:hypothetical protein
METSTLLYPLCPFALGQAECEGLISYLCRLAAAHTVSVDDLVNHCLSECSETDFRKWQHFSWWNRSKAASVFAPGRTVPLSDALVKATGVAEVHRLSLAALSSTLDLGGLSADHARHCPRCVRERPYPKAFRPILWDLRIVTACPTHHIRLVSSECGSSDPRRLVTWYRKQVPGVCTTCGSLALACADVTEMPASEEEIWLVDQISALIAAVSAGERFQFEDVRQGVFEMACKIGNGQPYRAASICGVNKARLFDWIRGIRPIKLSPLLALCAASGSELMSAMRGTPDVQRRSSFKYVANPRKPTYPSMSERKRVILDAMNDPGCPSAQAVAKTLGVSTRSMACTFPEETKKIAERFTLARHTATLERRKRAAHELAEVIQRLRSDGRAITVRNIHQASGILITKKSRYESVLRDLSKVSGAFAREGGGHDSEG